MAIVIYARKSVERENSISCETQIEHCRAMLRVDDRDEEIISIVDNGFSGGNVNRDGFQRMMHLIGQGKIRKVIVYKIDRISRSLSDFMEMTKLFARYNVSIVSVTQQIDTSSSMGRMIVNLLMSFAQYEREMTSDRVRDKMAASRKHGIWTGGIIPYGYKSENRKLVVDPERAPEPSV